MERSESLSKASYYKDISKKTQAYSALGPQESISIRPFSNYMSLRPQTAIKLIPDDHEKASMTEGLPEKEDSLKPRNLNLVAHFQRNFAEEGIKKSIRTQSAFNIRKPSARIATAKPVEQNWQKFSSHHNLIARNIQSAALHKQGIIEEEAAGQGESKSQKEGQSEHHHESMEEEHQTQNSHQKEKNELVNYFHANPKACLEQTLFELEKCQELLGVAEEAAEKRKEDLKREQMLMLTGRTNGAHPWDNISIYFGDEPEFNNPSYLGNYKREALLKVQEKDEKELRMLLDEAEERLDFYKKHAAIGYDEDFTYLKVTQARLTCIEVDRIKQQYKNKAEG